MKKWVSQLVITFTFIAWVIFSFLLLCKSLYKRRGGNDVCVYASFTEGSAPGNTAGHTCTYVVLVSAVAQCPRSLRSRLRSRITECFSFLLIRPWARDCLLIRSRNSWNSTFIPRAAIPHPVTDLGQPAFLTRTSSAYCRSCNEFLPFPLTFRQMNELPNAVLATRKSLAVSPPVYKISHALYLNILQPSVFTTVLLEERKIFVSTIEPFLIYILRLPNILNVFRRNL